MLTVASIEEVKTSIHKFSANYNFTIRENESSYILKKRFFTQVFNNSKEMGYSVIVIFKIDILEKCGQTDINTVIEFESKQLDSIGFVKKMYFTNDKKKEFLSDFEYLLNHKIENKYIAAKEGLIRRDIFTLENTTVVSSIIKYVLLLIILFVILVGIFT